MLTGYGFASLVSEQFRETEWNRIRKNDYIQSLPNRQILWRKIGKDKIAIAVNGIPTVVPLYPNIEAVIKTINSGEIQSVKRILEDSNSLVNKEDSREDSDEGILGLLNTLLGNGGLKIVQ
ncbi:hypothetical protein [Nostoc sp. CHAB 5715]|uniref:hypothetical protein n=1 Tax=Nostoc sp. CHAB 5715 TaxID=2780400 RepID=UPI001E33E603|nr:hypothetical protein [Nostoc sp. CHAB 5715]MCC5621257.1 hypothetical protein [Nostoc sp. CHAB 5715]